MNAKQILDQEFLEIRSRILDVASSLDRIQRAEGSVDQDINMQKILQSLSIAMSPQGDRTERIQLLFSRDYDEHWKDQFSMPK